MNIKIYTDGSCLGNPGAGGYAAIILYEDGRREEITDGESFTTNNRMELMAAIVALRKISAQDKVELFTDSSYLQNAFTQNWLANWKRRGWKSATGSAVKNQDLWTALDRLISNLNVNFHWVKGHAGNSLNERCDKLARTTAESFKYQRQPARSENIHMPAENIHTSAENIHTSAKNSETRSENIHTPIKNFETRYENIHTRSENLKIRQQVSVVSAKTGVMIDESGRKWIGNQLLLFDE